MAHAPLALPAAAAAAEPLARGEPAILAVAKKRHRVRRLPVTAEGIAKREQWLARQAQVLRVSRAFAEVGIEARELSDLRSKVSMSLCNLEHFHAFWSGSRRTIFCRSVARSDPFAPARGAPALPSDAVQIGTYAMPCSSALILQDLLDLLLARRAQDLAEPSGDVCSTEGQAAA